MRFKWVEKKNIDIDFELIYGSIAVFGYFCARFIPAGLYGMLFCPLKIFTGLPCPSCGATRSFLLMSRFNISEGFMMNPLFGAFFLLGIPIVTYCLAVSLYPFKRLRLVSMGEWGGRILLILIMGSLAGNWVYLYYSGR